MKLVAMAENRPAYSPRKANQHHDRGGWGENTHKDQRGIQVIIAFLRKVTVVFVGFTSKLIVEFNARVATGRPKVLEERWQCFEDGILQTTNKKRRH